MLRQPENITHNGVKLSDAIIAHRKYLDGDPSGARLNWIDANLRGADLRGAILSGADLRGAILSDANLRGAILSGAEIIDAGQRSDCYQFYLQLRENAEPMVLAGCRYMPLSHARRHWLETRGGTVLGNESQAMLDHGERIIAIRQEKDL